MEGALTGPKWLQPTGFQTGWKPEQSPTGSVLSLSPAHWKPIGLQKVPAHQFPPCNDKLLFSPPCTFAFYE